MTRKVSHGAATRRPVYSGNRRVPGLHERTLADASTVYEARLRIDGTDTTILLDATTKTDAIHEIEALRVDRERGELRHGQLTPTFDEVWPDLIAHMRARVGIRDERRRYSQATVDLYEQRLRDRIGPLLGRKQIGEITTDDLRRLIDKLTAAGLAPSTITSHVNIASRTFEYAKKRRLVAHNPVRDLDRDDRPGAKRQSEPRYLTVAELTALLVELSDTMRPVAATCTYAALRISEALGLRWRDIDFQAGTITVAGQLDRAGEAWIPIPKTAASAATLPLLPVLGRELARHRVRQAQRDFRRVQPDALVFTTTRGQPQSRRNVLRAVYTAGDNASLNSHDAEPVGLHDLRHSFVAAAFEHGLSAPEVAQLARHANPRVTLTMYAGLTDEAREKAIAKLANRGFGR